MSDTEKRHWRDNAPAMLRESFNGPNGEPCFTTLDRRWLWHVEGQLAVLATTDHLRDVQRDLAQFLHETCEHHWGSDWPGDDHVPAHRQCVWCNYVDWVSVGGEG